MLTFNGRELPRGVHVTEYRISSPYVSRRTIDVPDARGLIRTGGKLGNRTVTLTYVIIADSLAERMEIFHRLCQWCLTDGSAPLILPGMPDRFIEAECQTFPSDTIGDYDEEDITFTCDLPEFQSIREKSRSLEAGQNTVQIGGDLTTPAVFTLTIANDLTTPIIRIGAHTIEFENDVDAGSMVIDTEHGTVSLDGEDITSYVSLDSDLHVFLEPAKQVITLPAGVTGKITWRDRWI